ncbi:surface protein PspC [Streptococcus pneumoniae]|nr:surface protein PspC [Streptococcus pneumoniae]
MFASKSERKVRYSIRKFSIGVASVVVASLFLGGVVHAEVVGGTSQGIPLKATDKDELYEKAVKEVNIEISKHMSNRLDQLDRQSSGFTEILKKVQGVVEGYRKQIDEALSKDGVEKLGEEAKKKIDELVEAFQNNSDNQIPPKKPSQNDGIQGDDSSAGQGEQPGASNQGDSKPVPPETSGETNSPTKPKDSNNSMTTLEKELKEAKETAKTTLDNYRESRLKKENGGVFWFTDLLRESKESVEKYKKMFDEASSKERVETLVKEAEQEIEALVVKHKGREIGLERDKAKKAVTKHLAKLLNDIEKNLEKEQHINTVELIKKLEDIKQTYLHKLDGLTQTDQLQELVIESQSKLDEALSNFKKGLSSSSNSGSSTKPETPEKPEVKPTPETPEVKPVPQPAPPKPEVKPTPETPEVKPVPQPAPPKPEVKPTPETPEVKPVPQPAPPKTSKIFTASNGNTKITVMFETATEADSVNLKEVTTKEMIDNVTRQTGQGTVRIFDISLSKDGKETHVKGERVVRLAIGNIDSEIQVYHV